MTLRLSPGSVFKWRKSLGRAPAVCGETVGPCMGGCSLWAFASGLVSPLDRAGAAPSSGHGAGGEVPGAQSYAGETRAGLLMWGAVQRKHARNPTDAASGAVLCPFSLTFSWAQLPGEWNSGCGVLVWHSGRGVLVTRTPKEFCYEAVSFISPLWEGHPPTGFRGPPGEPHTPPVATGYPVGASVRGPPNRALLCHSSPGSLVAACPHGAPPSPGWCLLSTR